MARLPEHPDDIKMSLGEHLEELRRRVIYSLIAVFAGMIICFIFIRPLVRFLVTPVSEAIWALEKESGIGDADLPGPDDGGAQGRRPAPLIALTPTEIFITSMKTALVAGLVISSPLVFYQLWLFVAAGLYPHERRIVHIFIPFSAALFLVGTFFSYRIVLRYGLPLLLNFAGVAFDIARPAIRLSAAINFVLMMSVVMGLVFQLPLVMMALAKVGLATTAGYIKHWKYAIVAIVAISAVLTPPDVFTQLSMAVPMVVLYWLGVLLSRIAVRKD